MFARAAVFDLDNTLVYCTRYYAEARGRVYDLVRLVRPDLSRDEFEARFRTIDTSLMRTPFGFRRDRFPTSARKVYRVLCEEVGHVPTSGELDAAWAAAEEVFSAPYELYPGAIETLAWCRDHELRLALCTKGDPDVQWRKLELHGLDQFFDHIAIVPQKHAREIGAAADALCFSREEIVMVGDSLREDIDGARVAGLGTVWVKGDALDFPELYSDARDVRPDVAIERIGELPGAIRPRGSVVFAERERAGSSRIIASSR